MKKLLLPLLLFVIFIGNGQTPPPKAGDPQKIEAMKVGLLPTNCSLLQRKQKYFGQFIINMKQRKRQLENRHLEKKKTLNHWIN